eukprot:gene16698-18392_t
MAKAIILEIYISFEITNRRTAKVKAKTKQPSNVELKNNVEFQYDKGVQNQQCPLTYEFPPKSLPATPFEQRKASQPTIERRHSLDPRTLDLQMYQREKRESMGSLTCLGMGSLCFKLFYERETEKLFVTVASLSKILSKIGNSTPQLFIKIQLLPDKKRRLQTKTIKDCNPEFYEQFIFTVPCEEILNRTLKFTVCNYDRFSRQNIYGYVIFPVVDAKEDLVLDDGTGEIWREITKDEVPPGEANGQVLLSLSHLPTAGRLTMVILKGAKLRVHDDTDSSVYVKISMISGGKPIKSKKTTNYRKRDIMNPVFNESFVFETPTEYMDRISFVLSICAHTRSSSGKRVVGRVVIGPYMYSTGDGLAHWNEMLHSPRHSIANWHKLC